MRRVVYVTNRLRGSGVGGREQLSQLHGQVLQVVCDGRFECIELDETGGIGRLFGYLDGVCRSSIDHVCARIVASGSRQVFLDGSNLGRLAEGIKKLNQNVEILTFFHNCEARFFLGALRRSRSPRALAVLMANYLAERSAVRYSDKRVCLSERDSALIRRLYGHGATHISAMAIHDKLPGDGPTPHAPPPERYVLFVGGSFYANKMGIAWFCQNVAPRISLKTIVVGKGLQAMKDDLEQHVNVMVIGEVDDLAPWYRNAQVVVAPIFDGSGMKTKVAEALMFGKRIIGTPEAFSGYEDIADMAGEICVDSREFVTAIEREAECPFVALEPQLRAFYETRYSFSAASSRFCIILGSSLQADNG